MFRARTVRELAFPVEHANHLVFIDDEQRGGRNRTRSCHANGFARKAPFPRKSPGPKIPRTASLPGSLTTESFAPPSWMYMTCSAGSPCPKTISLFRNVHTLFPRPVEARNRVTSKAALPDFALGERRTMRDARRGAEGMMWRDYYSLSCLILNEEAQRDSGPGRQCFRVGLAAFWKQFRLRQPWPVCRGSKERL